jgi:tetratricopeptide (TPR) repeat protein
MIGGDRRGFKRTSGGWTAGIAAILMVIAQIAAAADTDAPSARTIEASFPELARSLTLLSVAPTAENHRRVADEYLRLHVVDAAYTHYTAAVKLAPGDGLAHAGLAAVWRAWGFDDRSLGEAYRAVYFAPGAAAPHNALGVALASLGYWDEARSQFNRARRLDDTASYPVANLCGLELDQNHVPEALALCGEAVGLADVAPATHALFGVTLARAGEFTRAHEEFLRAGTRAEAAYDLGMAYLRAGREEDAARAFRSVVVANPAATRAIERLRTLATRPRGVQ